MWFLCAKMLSHVCSSVANRIKMFPFCLFSFRHIIDIDYIFIIYTLSRSYPALVFIFSFLFFWTSNYFLFCQILISNFCWIVMYMNSIYYAFMFSEYMNKIHNIESSFISVLYTLCTFYVGSLKFYAPILCVELLRIFYIQYDECNFQHSHYILFLLYGLVWRNGKIFYLKKNTFAVHAYKII